MEDLYAVMRLRPLGGTSLAAPVSAAAEYVDRENTRGSLFPLRVTLVPHRPLLEENTRLSHYFLSKFIMYSIHKYDFKEIALLSITVLGNNLSRSIRKQNKMAFFVLS